LNLAEIQWVSNTDCRFAHTCWQCGARGSRRDNFPNTGGEVKPAGQELAKISCLEQALPVHGLVLPIQ
jgi:hypothetical protein